MENNENNAFEKVISEGEDTYRKLKDVLCPYFNEIIHFNAQGLQHLKFKRHEVARAPNDQIKRFQLIQLAPYILKITRTLQGYWETKGFERIRIHFGL
jgi:hypothetical protein